MAANSDLSNVPKRIQVQLHKCICCNKDVATGRDTVELLSTSPRLLTWARLFYPLHHLLAFYWTALNILLFQIRSFMVSALSPNFIDNIHFFKLFMLYHNFCSYIHSQRRQRILYRHSSNINNENQVSANEYEEAKLVFETAKSDFVTAFCNFHRDTSMRRCKYVKQCKTSQLLIQIEGDVSTHHSNDFVNPDFANVILSQPIPAQTINFIHTIQQQQLANRQTWWRRTWISRKSGCWSWESW